MVRFSLGPSLQRALASLGMKVGPRVALKRPVIQALLVLPSPVGHRVVVLLCGGLEPAAINAVQERARLVQEMATAGGCPITLECRDRLPFEDLLQLAVCGAWLGGRILPQLWDSLPPAELPPSFWTHWMASAPSELSWLALLCAAQQTPEALWRRVLELAGAAPLSKCIAPERMALGLLPREDPARQLLERVDAGLHHQETVQEEVDPWFGPPAPPPPAQVARDVFALGRAVAGLAFQRWRRLPVPLRHLLARQFHSRVVASGLPMALVPVFRKAVRFRQGVPAPWLFVASQKPGSRRHVVEHPAGFTWAQGGSPLQAKVRALALYLQVAPHAGWLPAFPRPWNRLVAAMMAQDHTPELVCLVHGLPLVDDRRTSENLERCAFEGADMVSVAPGHRAAGIHLPQDAALQRLMRAYVAGHQVTLDAANATGHAPAARLRTFLEPAVHDLRHSVRLLEGDSRTWLLFRERFTSLDPEIALARPRVLAREALSLGARMESNRALHVIDCKATLSGRRVSLLYRDGTGATFQEHVPLQRVAQHLEDAQEMLRACMRPTILVIQADDGLLSAAHRQETRAGSAPIKVLVEGSLPLRLLVQVAGETFCGSTPLGWHAAALSITSRWPVMVGGALQVWARVDAHHGLSEGISRLYARSVVARRLGIHIRRVTRPYRPPGQ